MSQPKKEFLNGIKATLPIMIGVVPFGLIYGAAALKAGIPASIAQAMSVIVFAGSAQFIITRLVGADTPALVIILTAFIVNLRHMLYSVSLVPHLKDLSSRWKWLLSYLLIDESYAVAIARYQDQQDEITHKHWYFLGAGLALWSIWQVCTAAGIILGAQIPESWPLDFAIPLTFIALVVPMLKDRADVLAALTASGVVLLAAGLPYKLDLIVAAFAGIAVGIGATRQ